MKIVGGDLPGSNQQDLDRTIHSLKSVSSTSLKTRSDRSACQQKGWHDNFFALCDLRRKSVRGGSTVEAWISKVIEWGNLRRCNRPKKNHQNIIVIGQIIGSGQIDSCTARQQTFQNWFVYSCQPKRIPKKRGEEPSSIGCESRLSRYTFKTLPFPAM